VISPRVCPPRGLTSLLPDTVAGSDRDRHGHRRTARCPRRRL